jgi:hypothetical protein
LGPGKYIFPGLLYGGVISGDTAFLKKKASEHNCLLNLLNNLSSPGRD